MKQLKEFLLILEPKHTHRQAYRFYVRYVLAPTKSDAAKQALSAWPVGDAAYKKLSVVEFYPGASVAL